MSKKSQSKVLTDVRVESMTGYGEHRTKIAGTTVICRVRSLNHRFLDLKLRLPRSDLMSLDMTIRKRLAEVFKRGSIEVTVTVECNRETTDASINTKLAETYTTAAKALAKKLKLPGTGLSVEALMRMPGVVMSGTGPVSGGTDDFLAGAEDAHVMSTVIEPALQALKLSRQTEGTKLSLLIQKHLDEMELHLAAIKALEQPEKERARKLIVERAQETLKLLESLSSAPVNEEFAARLRDEAVFWIERRDFDEEKERLGMHLKDFRQLLVGEASGRKLEFIQQELLREINTLGTKAQSPAITTRTIELKTILERVREQLANVE